MRKARETDSEERLKIVQECLRCRPSRGNIKNGSPHYEERELRAGSAY